MSDARTVLVTGGAKRIGAAIVRLFHQQNFNVIIHYHQSATEAEGLAKELNNIRADSATTLGADLTDLKQASTLAEQCQTSFGRIDVLVNNASAFYPTPLPVASSENWDELINSNLRAAFILSQALAPELEQRKGSIINIIDAMVEKTLPRHSLYNIAKAGLKAMTKSLATELAPAVRVNGVAPGAILWPSSLQDEQNPEVAAKREKVLKGIPLGSLGNSEDIARAVYFLACQATYVTGETLKVDGGRSLS